MVRVSNGQVRTGFGHLGTWTGSDRVPANLVRTRLNRPTFVRRLGAREPVQNCGWLRLPPKSRPKSSSDGVTPSDRSVVVAMAAQAQREEQFNIALHEQVHLGGATWAPSCGASKWRGAAAALPP